MITANDVRPGSTYEWEGNLYQAISQSAHHMGRGGATVRIKMQDMRSGAIFERTFGPDDKFQDVRLESRSVQYLYNDGEVYHFMDTETYEQPAINASQLGDRANFLIENMELSISFYDAEPITIEMPAHVDLEVTYTEPGVKGNTATGATKVATLSTGVNVNVPLFINQGDTLRVDTRTGQYVTRVSK